MNFLRFMGTFTFFKHLILALILVVAIVFFYLQFLPWYTNHGEEVRVPNVLSMTEDKFEDVLDDLDLDYTISESAQFNPKFPPNSVISQQPVAGDLVKQGRKLFLKINPSDFRDVRVPNLVFQTKRQAIPTLEALDFKIGRITYEANYAKDMVLEMRYKGRKLDAGSLLKRTSAIDLVLGDPTLLPDYEPEEEDVDASPRTPVPATTPTENSEKTPDNITDQEDNDNDRF